MYCKQQSCGQCFLFLIGWVSGDCSSLACSLNPSLLLGTVCTKLLGQHLPRGPKRTVTRGAKVSPRCRCLPVYGVKRALSCGLPYGDVRFFSTYFLGFPRVFGQVFLIKCLAALVTCQCFSCLVPRIALLIAGPVSTFASLGFLVS